jgi:alpha-acetolactate decarboxylase
MFSTTSRYSASTSARDTGRFSHPAAYAGINVAGYHEHFITDDRQGGGHLLDYQLDTTVLTFGDPQADD